MPHEVPIAHFKTERKVLTRRANCHVADVYYIQDHRKRDFELYSDDIYWGHRVDKTTASSVLKVHSRLAKKYIIYCVHQHWKSRTEFR